MTDARLIAIEDNIKRVREEIALAAQRCGRKPEEVRLMAVTKTVEPLYINHAIAQGIDLIGENKVQEFLLKRDSLRLDGVEKHLIGHLQSNKARKIVGQVDMIESVDSFSLAAEIDRQSEKLGVVSSVLIELNIGSEQSKTGMEPSLFYEQLYKIAELEHIRIKGLMTIPPICESKTELAKFFEKMYNLFIDIGAKKIDNVSMDVLSMGMSGDYAEAVEFGSTLVRVGSAIFGARNYAK